MMGLRAALLGSALLATMAFATETELKVQLLPGEGWHGGATTFGRQAPYGLKSQKLKFDIRRSGYQNGTAPLLLSTKGRYIWSDKAFAIELKEGTLILKGDASIKLYEGGKTLRDAYLTASKKHFPPSGKLPDLALIDKPQWNTWVELTYNQNQKDILAYAKAIAANGFPQGGVIMIDDTWQLGYGVWEFDPRRFNDPKGLIDELHAMGYKVMLWVCPFVSMDTPGYREMAFGLLDSGKKTPAGGFICQEKDDPKAVSWWNGKSADIDFTHPLGAAWFARNLKRLQEVYGVDGFKFDAGDTEQYRKPYLTNRPAEPYELCSAYAAIGLQFPLNEYRSCFGHAGQPIVLRLCDKDHRWEAVQQLIPDIIQSGLMGYPFVCPDMIASGSWMAFAPDAPTPYDRELFVRSAQVHALSPMMQFSAAPWRMLKGADLEAVRAAAQLRMKWTPYILEVAKASAQTGEPMLRSLEYAYPGQGWEKVADQFLMGDDLLVAPQVVKGATERTVVIPPGKWLADDGATYSGPAEVTIKTPLSRLPHFQRVQ